MDKTSDERGIKMKGIILAAGSGTRLYPVTRAVAKPLLPVYDKPMMHYPLTLLMQAGIRDIMMVISEKDLESFERVYGDGSNLGIHICYGIQKEPRGIADALIVAKEFINGDSVCFTLGDNVLNGPGLTKQMRQAAKVADEKHHATIFGYYVEDPRAFGVVGFDEHGKPVSLTEKPSEPESSYAVIGLYFYDSRAVEFAENLKPSARGELEITDVNKAYLEAGDLDLKLLDKRVAWFDAGTFESLVDTTDFVRRIQNEYNCIQGCPEETSYRNGWITKDELMALGEGMSKSGYGKYLEGIAKSAIDDNID